MIVHILSTSEKENSQRKPTNFAIILLAVRHTVDDEMTAPQLTKRINNRFGKHLSQDKVKRLRRKLGWVCTATKYCQLIRGPNRLKGQEFSEKCLQDNEQFEDVIFTDECSVFLENHSKISFHRRWEQPRLKGKPKHPVKVHVWGGISKRGPTKLIIFEGIMDAEFYVSEILLNGLLPFIRDTFPDSHRFQQDNDPKHTSRLHVGTKHQLVKDTS